MTDLRPPSVQRKPEQAPAIEADKARESVDVEKMREALRPSGD